MWFWDQPSFALKSLIVPRVRTVAEAIESVSGNVFNRVPYVTELGSSRLPASNQLIQRDSVDLLLQFLPLYTDECTRICEPHEFCTFREARITQSCTRSTLQSHEVSAKHWSGSIPIRWRSELSQRTGFSCVLNLALQTGTDGIGMFRCERTEF